MNVRNLILLSALLSTQVFASKTLPYYELTVRAALDAQYGWTLYRQGRFAGSFPRGGNYTDPMPEQQGYEFWSNGTCATLDGDSNGHQELQFKVSGDQLIYVGAVGGKGTFVHTANEYKHLQGMLVTPYGQSCFNHQGN